MIDKPQYIIVAGINGAGKSTLYDTFPSLFDKTKRINADELLRQMGGDWHKDSDNLKAMKEEMKYWMLQKSCFMRRGMKKPL